MDSVCIDGRANAHRRLLFIIFKAFSALRLRKNIFFEFLILLIFWPLGPSPCCRGIDLESNALIGIEINEKIKFGLKMFVFNPKSGFWIFLGVYGFSGIVEISFFFLFLGDLLF